MNSPVVEGRIKGTYYGRVEPYQEAKRIAAVRVELLEVSKELAELQNVSENKTGAAVCAFVTFENETAYMDCIRRRSPAPSWWVDSNPSFNINLWTRPGSGRRHPPGGLTATRPLTSTHGRGQAAVAGTFLVG